MNQRRTADEWRQILQEQREQGLSDRDCCARYGAAPSSLKRWRGRLGLGGTRGHRPFVELPIPQTSVGEIRIILPNRIELAVGPGWTADQVAAMAGRLAAL
jgi:hypothetical protein